MQRLYSAPLAFFEAFCHSVTALLREEYLSFQNDVREVSYVNAKRMLFLGSHCTLRVYIGVAPDVITSQTAVVSEQ